ncbi:hypothetical protein MNBD_GAMMA25-2062, partial [hydrothermal vent metagenome]
MAQADLLVSLVKSATSGDQLAMRKVAENLIQEEKNKGHRVLADRLTKALRPDIFKPLGTDTITQNGRDGRYK